MQRRLSKEEAERQEQQANYHDYYMLKELIEEYADDPHKVHVFQTLLEIISTRLNKET